MDAKPARSVKATSSVTNALSWTTHCNSKHHVHWYAVFYGFPLFESKHL